MFMKSFIYAFIALLFFGACDSQKSNSFLVEGKLDGIPEGTTIFLSSINVKTKETVNIDTAIVKEQQFAFHLEKGATEKYFMRFDKQKVKTISLLLDSVNIKIQGSFSALKDVQITGGANGVMMEMIRIKLKQNESLRNLKKSYGDRRKTKEGMLEMYNKYNQMLAQFAVENVAFIKKHPNSSASAFILQEHVVPASRYDFKLWKEAYLAIDPSLTELAPMKAVWKKIGILERTSIGQAAPDFTLINVEGKEISLSSLRGKPVMIDFWASWCKPCRKSFPVLKKTYAKYHKQGFEVLGVSVDTKKELWLRALDIDQLPWLQVVSLDGMKSEIARLYGVESIPFTLLLDEEGKIVGKNLHGAKLENKIENLLPNS